jgi:hypothetical protein
MYFTQLTDSLEFLLQRTAKFNINDKTLREGKIILYNLKDYYIEFVLITKKDQRKVYEIPVPYGISVRGNKVTYSYDLKLAVNSKFDDLVTLRLLAASLGKKSKFYNNMLIIEV